MRQAYAWCFKVLHGYDVGLWAFTCCGLPMWTKNQKVER